MTRTRRRNRTNGFVALAVAAGLSLGQLSAAATEEAPLDRIEWQNALYLLEQRDERSGLVYNTTEAGAPASPAACGVALSVIPIGIERGWITREEGFGRAKRMLEMLHRIEHVHGFFYHFLDPRSGRRTWQSEVSCIDSSILFAGAMVVASYFQGTAVESLANQLIERADWPWFLHGDDTLRWAWRPESGFEDGPMEFSESVLAYLLALGSPTHPISVSSWDAMKRPITLLPSESSHAMVFTPDGSLFAYLLPLAWFDLRGRHDAYLDYWTNARTAILTNMRFSSAHQAQFETYRRGFWGLSAALGPDGYRAYGAQPAAHVTHDGTVAPYIVAASVPWFPDVALSTYTRMEEAMPTLHTRYGLGDALNLDRHYACPHTIALDQGLAALLIENARTGLIWNLFMRHPMAQRALAAAGFVQGSLPEPSIPSIIPGNPGATMTVPMMDHAVTVDADLREWIRREAIELSPVKRRNLETGHVHDSRDSSALIYLGWIREMLYVAGIVNDDVLVTRFTGDHIYTDDCIELFWDLDGDGFRFDGNPHDVQLGLAPSGPHGKWQVWMWGAIKRSPTDVQAVVKRMPGHYLFEIGVPMTLLPGLTPGVPIRFSVALHDRDHDEQTSKLTWSIDTATKPGEILFGRVTLTDAPLSASGQEHR